MRHHIGHADCERFCSAFIKISHPHEKAAAPTLLLPLRLFAPNASDTRCTQRVLLGSRFWRSLLWTALAVLAAGFRPQSPVRFDDTANDFCRFYSIMLCFPAKGGDLGFRKYLLLRNSPRIVSFNIANASFSIASETEKIGLPGDCEYAEIGLDSAASVSSSLYGAVLIASSSALQFLLCNLCPVTMPIGAELLTRSSHGASTPCGSVIWVLKLPSPFCSELSLRM